VLERLARKPMKAEFDVKYWQVEVKPKSGRRCAVQALGELLEPTRLPMGGKDSGPQL
jgi:glycine/serine hydroxymethyltransferase